MIDASAARDWLLRRLPPPPRELLDRMLTALGESAPAVDLSSRLGEAAVVCLTAAIDRVGERAAALDLLAADALLTYACEAAAESEPGGLERFARDFGAERLALLLRASP
jgi:hypothetical protein